MKKTAQLSMLLAIAAFVAACSTTPRTTGRLEQARAEFAAAQSNQNVVTYAPVELKQAGDALQQANAMASEREKEQKIDQQAYIAIQRIAVAQEAAKQRMAEANISSAAREREQLRLQQRTMEADTARARAAQLESQLAEMKAQQTERGMVVTIGDVQFAVGSWRLNAAGMRDLRKLANFMQQNPQRRVLIEGFTDSTGSESSNQQLSERRAYAVRDALLGMGVSSTRMETVGYGESYPVAPNDTAANRRLNRRVEVIISDESGKIMPRR